MVNLLNLYQELPQDVQLATKTLVETFLSKLYPSLQKMGYNIQTYLKDNDLRENVMNIYNVFTLCVSQIGKCYLSMIDIFKLEHREQLIMLESRQCTLERLSWCCKRLESIEHQLEAVYNQDMDEGNLDGSVFATPMYFVNWIDQTFDVLKKLTDLVSMGSKESEFFDHWKNEMVECLSSLRMSVDELLLSAMTLCRYCLPADQHIIKARCQVVLRETKALLSDIIEGDIDTILDSSILPLRLPLKPSNMNVLIDVLRDVLYVLETNTNTALLALLDHCYSYSISPVDVLKRHYDSNNKGKCKCLEKSGEEITETCNFIKEFDLHNERLLQIGSFAVSCSSDEKRILALRSSLASLEALDPHLIPAIIMAPESHHSALLMNCWNKEVLEIRDSVFLIVDPAAFADKAKQMMHQKLLDILKNDFYDNNMICSVINMGCVVYDFFCVYNKYEPDAVNEREKLLPLLEDLQKVQLECKVVSDILSSEKDFTYNVKKTKSTKVMSLDQMYKRLKLLYTIVNRINILLHPKDTDDDFFANEEDDVVENNDVTHSVCFRNYETYVRGSPKNSQNKLLLKSIFARTANIRSPASKLPLFKLTKHLKQKRNQNLNFSVQLDELCNRSDLLVQSNRDSLNFFYSPMRKRPSLRKAVFNRHKFPIEKEKKFVSEPNETYEESCFVDESLGLQITEVLNQISDLTATFSTTKTIQAKSIPSDSRQCRKKGKNEKQSGKVLRLNMNNINTTVTKHHWNIPVNRSSMESDPSIVTSNISQPSNVTTLERLSDLDLVESKLSDLRVMQLETSL